MNENGSGGEEVPAVAAAVVETRSRPSIVWLIPLVAALVGGFVAWRAFSERGPEITISFKSAEGLEAGKTKIKYKDVDVGMVEGVELAPDLSSVICRARMVKGANPYLTDKTQFWVVRPRIAGGQVTGLSTLLSGSYIGIDPVKEGKHAHEFTGLDAPPIILATEPGRTFVLRSDRAGTLDVAAPVFFRKVQVGRVVSSELDPDDESVTTKIFVQSPYDERVRSDSRFWNASGIDVQVSAQGVRIDTESVVSILIGGIAFDTPPDSTAPAAPDDAVFPLYENHQEALKRRFARRVAWMLHFDQSVRGLAVGAPVEFRGMPLGEVTDIRLEYDPALGRFVIPVRIEIEPERIEGMNLEGDDRRTGLDRLVAQGLRAQLATGNLVTGQLIVSLDFHKDAPPAQIVWDDVPEFPTIPTPFEEITESLTRIAQGLGKVPFEQIGVELEGSLAALRVTLRQSEGVAPALKSSLEKLETTLASANALIGPDSNVDVEVQRALLELSEAARALALAANQFQTQPDSVIFGKKGSQ